MKITSASTQALALFSVHQIEATKVSVMVEVHCVSRNFFSQRRKIIYKLIDRDVSGQFVRRERFVKQKEIDFLPLLNLKGRFHLLLKIDQTSTYFYFY